MVVYFFINIAALFVGFFPENFSLTLVYWKRVFRRSFPLGSCQLLRFTEERNEKGKKWTEIFIHWTEKCRRKISCNGEIIPRVSICSLLLKYKRSVNIASHPRNNPRLPLIKYKENREKEAFQSETFQDIYGVFPFFLLSTVKVM